MSVETGIDPVEQAAAIRCHACSPAQERFWILDRLLPGNPALNIAVRWRLEGVVEPHQIERAFRLILARHETLRTALVEEASGLVQRVLPHVPFELPVLDLTALPPAAAEAEMERVTKLEARASFDLASAPLLRVRLIRLSAADNVVLVTVHHIVADGWSIGVLAHEMGEICAALQAGRLPSLPPLKLSYGEHVSALRTRLDQADFAADEAFWRGALAGVKHFELPTDFPRPPEQTANGAIASILLPRATTDAFGRLARRNGCTLFMTALAVLFTLLHRYSGETDIAIGTQIAGRDEVELEGLVGLFINTLILRADLSGDPAFEALLERMQDLVSDAFEHQHLPLERVIEIMAPARDLSRNALFSVNFIFQRSFIENATYGDFRLVDMPSRSAGALYDLNFFMVERPEGWRISCEYNTDLFAAETAQRLVGHFRNLMQAAIDNAEAKLSAMPILDAAEERALIIDANDTAAPYPQEALPALFAAQAAKTPDAIAVSCSGRSLSYAALDRQATLLAQCLAAQGVAGRLVGVMLERSAELPAVLLGIQRAAAAYVPLDPAYPAARLAQIAEDAGLAAMVTRSELRARLPGPAVPVIELDRLAPPAPAPALPEIALESRAYVIFTSGSTGRPKGVQVSHRALVNLLWAMRARPGLSAADVLVSPTTIAFDIAALELFLPLITGARLVLATAAQAADGAELLALLKREAATVLQATPVTWELLIEAGWRGEKRLKALCGGEALSRRLANQLLDRAAEVWNMYGPTETTIWSAASRVQPGSGPVPIGGIVANTQFYVVDSQGNLVPPGAPGELLIGGDGVAQGYLGLDELTAEKFCPDRFRPGGRLYRTGDIVRSRRAGEFEYLGRTDHQVKLRGFRIELGEIEAAILDDAAIAEAVVVLREAALAAYVVPAARRAPGELAAGLRRHLAQGLPRYMQPQSITVLDALPRTPNGKIDRDALPKPQAAPVAAVETALDPIEQRLAIIWQEVLGLEAVDKTADFFELGGHSLLAARLLLRVEAEFGGKISLASLFKASTLEAMAKLLKQSQLRQHDFRQVVRLQAGGRKLPVIGINNTGLYFTLSKRLGTDRPFTALQLFDPSFSRDQLPETFEAIAEQYVALIREVQPTGPYALLGWCIGGAIAFEIARQLTAAGEEVCLLALIDTWAPGHIRDLGPIRGRLTDYAYRWQLIRRDWAASGGLGRFLGNRLAVQKILRLLGRQAAPSEAALGALGRYVSAEAYDQLLLNYLEQSVRRYRPGRYAGKVTILRSEREPGGLFLDPKLGWQRHSDQEVELATIEGDHFTIFTGAGVDQIAAELGRRLEPFDRAVQTP